MSSKIVRNFSLVIYSDGSNDWDILPQDIVKLIKMPDVGTVFFHEKLYPLRILKTSENKNELLSMAMKRKNKMNEKREMLNSLTNLKRDHVKAEMIKEDAKEKVTRENQNIEKENAIYYLYPYMKQTEDKVELIPQSNVWISNNSLCLISNKCNSATPVREITSCLLKELLGAKNLKYLHHYLREVDNRKYIPLPEVVCDAIRKYVTQNCKIESSDKILEFNNNIESIKDVTEETFAKVYGTISSEMPTRTSKTFSTVKNFANTSVTNFRDNSLITSTVRNRKRENKNEVDKDLVRASKQRKLLSINNSPSQE